MKVKRQDEMNTRSVMSRLLIIYLICAAYTALFFAVGGDDILNRDDVSRKPETSSSGIIGEITDGMCVEQTFTVQNNDLRRLDIQTGTYDRVNHGTMTLQLLDESGTQVTQCVMELKDVQNGTTPFVFEDKIDGSIVDRKLNVAMTRAEEHLVMFGNAELLSNNFTFFKLLEFVRSKHGFFRVQKDDFVAGRFEVPQYDAEELNLSLATFSVSGTFNAAFVKHVFQPVKDASGEEWPSKVFGHDMATNLNAIGYGRINFSNQLQMFDEQVSPDRQVLIYCYYIMRQHYCSSLNLFSTYKDWMRAQISSVDGRVQMVDIGCGPATCGIAFCEVFEETVPGMVYIGIDISIEMKRMGKRMLDDMFSGKLHHQMLDSVSEMDMAYWEGCSELPSLIIFNMSYFFSNVTAHFTERLALQITEIMRRHPLNKYLFIVQHSESDEQLNSYKVFRQLLRPVTRVIKSEKTSFTYMLNYKERTLAFCYDMFASI